MTGRRKGAGVSDNCGVGMRSDAVARKTTGGVRPRPIFVEGDRGAAGTADTFHLNLAQRSDADHVIDERQTPFGISPLDSTCTSVGIALGQGVLRRTAAGE